MYYVLISVIIQNVRIGYSMLSNAEEIGAISPGKVHFFFCVRINVIFATFKFTVL